MTEEPNTPQVQEEQPFVLDLPAYDTVTTPEGRTPDVSEKATEVKFIKPKLCNLDLLIPSTTARIIREHPNTELVKGIIMNLFGQSPPPELKTYNEVREWIETTFTNMVAKDAQASRPAIAVAQPILSVNIMHERTEIGRCSYKQQQSRLIEFDMTLEDVRECIHSGASSISELIDMIKEYAISNIQENGSNVDWDESSEETYDHESTDTEDDILVPMGGVNTTIHDWLNHNLTQRMRDDMGI